MIRPPRGQGGLQSVVGHSCGRSSEVLYRMGDHTSKGQLLYVVYLPYLRGEARHMWGTSFTARYGDGSSRYRIWCLRRGRETVLIVGTDRHIIQAAPEWAAEESFRCSKAWGAKYNFLIYVADAEAQIGHVPFEVDAPEPGDEQFWVEYAGPFTNGAVRVSGPWG